jgi:ATP synthase subunit 6
MFYSPLEQFQIIPVFPIHLGKLDISLTNSTIISGLSLFFFLTFLFILLDRKNYSLFLVPNRWQTMIETLYKVLVGMVTDNVGPKGEKYFPFIFTLFLFIVTSNLIGLVPYSFTLTSHLIVTFSLALIVFISVNIIGARQHGMRMFSLFLPAGTSLPLAFLLVPIELVSYIFKPISLSVRLFANLMAGHTLLKVIAGFGWSLMGCTGLLFLAHYVPLLVLLPLFGLELAVALIQAYVFSILSCIYLNDALNLH